MGIDELVLTVGASGAVVEFEYGAEGEGLGVTGSVLAPLERLPYVDDDKDTDTDVGYPETLLLVPVGRVVLFEAGNGVRTESMLEVVVAPLGIDEPDVVFVTGNGNAVLCEAAELVSPALAVDEPPTGTVELDGRGAREEETGRKDENSEKEPLPVEPGDDVLEFEVGNGAVGKVESILDVVAALLGDCVLFIVDDTRSEDTGAAEPVSLVLQRDEVEVEPDDVQLPVGMDEIAAGEELPYPPPDEPEVTDDSSDVELGKGSEEKEELDGPEGTVTFVLPGREVEFENGIEELDVNVDSDNVEPGDVVTGRLVEVTPVEPVEGVTVTSVDEGTGEAPVVASDDELVNAGKDSELDDTVEGTCDPDTGAAILVPNIDEEFVDVLGKDSVLARADVVEGYVVFMALVPGAVLVAAAVELLADQERGKDDDKVRELDCKEGRDGDSVEVLAVEAVVLEAAKVPLVGRAVSVVFEELEVPGLEDALAGDDKDEEP
ncbi:hypothetical protein NKR23_g1612 [Pleurostoma richardsiae]|uniref:Uncharacterized protein n=1 Tax=Pleurostoma richardsiae TaxID=41990 RepID=A0AA38VVH6_9PEZI|nr:hypothetical protein NKR23_g1612 [Pleurostoma richardsiae]